jgi:hypothetical protein
MIAVAQPTHPVFVSHFFEWRVRLCVRATRELFIPETQELVRPHEHFMLFATQNPPGVYGGRKTLSLAFRNRFLELHVDDIPGTTPTAAALLLPACGGPSFPIVSHHSRTPFRFVFVSL